MIQIICDNCGKKISLIEDHYRLSLVKMESQKSVGLDYCRDCTEKTIGVLLKQFESKEGQK